MLKKIITEEVRKVLEDLREEDSLASLITKKLTDKKDKKDAPAITQYFRVDDDPDSAGNQKLAKAQKKRGMAFVQNKDEERLGKLIDKITGETASEDEKRVFKQITKKQPKKGQKKRRIRRDSCSINARLIKKIPDLGPNVKSGTKSIQTLLNLLGYGKLMPNAFKSGKSSGALPTPSTGIATGVCDKDLIKAISAFQRDTGITIDGLYGPETHSAMQKAVKKHTKLVKVRDKFEKEIGISDEKIKIVQKALDKAEKKYAELDEKGIEPSDGFFASDEEEMMFNLERKIERLSYTLRGLEQNRGDYVAGAKKQGIDL